MWFNFFLHDNLIPVIYTDIAFAFEYENKLIDLLLIVVLYLLVIIYSNA